MPDAKEANNGDDCQYWNSGYPLPSKPHALDRGVSPNLMSEVSEVVAYVLQNLQSPQTSGALENVDFELVLKNQIKLAVHVLLREFFPINLLTIHSFPPMAVWPETSLL